MNYIYIYKRELVCRLNSFNIILIIVYLCWFWIELHIMMIVYLIFELNLFIIIVEFCFFTVLSCMRISRNLSSWLVLFSGEEGTLCKTISCSEGKNKCRWLQQGYDVREHYMYE